MRNHINLIGFIYPNNNGVTGFRIQLISQSLLSWGTDNMKLSASLAILVDLRLAFQAALGPTIQAVLHSPSLIFRPAALSHLFMSHVWTAFGPGVDENGRSTKHRLITTNASGVVLDIGAGQISLYPCKYFS